MTTKPDYDKLYAIAEPQGGFFTAQQAQEIGFSYERLSSNVKSGRFLRVAHGIYRLAHFPASPFEDLFIAILRAGPDAVISHESALAVLGLSEVPQAVVHVTVPHGAARRAGIRRHTGDLDESEITRRDGLPVTSAARTLADVAAAGLPEDQVTQAIDAALARGVVSEDALQQYASFSDGRLGRIMRAGRFAPDQSRRTGPGGIELVRQFKEEILRIAEAHGAYDVRIFGSSSRGEATEDSDIDLLVSLAPERSILDLVAVKQDLEDELEREVDVVTEDSLSPYIREQVLKEAVPL